ncbi:MAG: hypothetical protein GOVbin2937_13 [Prokaryotic dsDNA virus sp.]|nr:MAG: hypothetical protein GOVbin2937_13 [Prokaryotic dsDNA virus sp.]|tara:strand:+ start:6808 stop:7125 length:318 start_codon:yes stop_codon:yes gene_type:complete
MTNANALPIQARLRGSVAAAAQAYTDAWFNNPGTARPVHCIPAKETDTDLVLAQGIKEAADRIDALEKALREGRDLIAGDATGAEWKRGCSAFLQSARAALGEGE